MPTQIIEIVAAPDTVIIDIAGTTAINAETFNGAIPGPFILAMKDDTLIIRLINRLGHPTGIHWHGIELQNYSDGTPVTQNGVPGGILQTINGVPGGGTYLYKFKVPRPGIYWYHPHHHHSTNRVFRGQYGMLVVSDPDEETLVTGGILPSAANTHRIVLSDITVCKAPGSNDAATYVDPTTLPLADRAEWLSGVTAQTGSTPTELCELPTALTDHGDPAVVNFNAGEIPGNHNVNAGRTVEGQTVLTNGVNVGGRLGTPNAPGALAPGAITINAQPGQGIRFQFVNSATLRYFRLVLTTSSGTQIPLIRVGGEGGVLDHAIIEGGVISGFNTRYNTGEILIPTASRADVVAVLPPGVTGVFTMWTRDFQRTGPANLGNWAQLPTVPVLHLNVTGPDLVPAYNLIVGAALKASIPGAAAVPLGAPTNILLDPATFVPLKPGSSNQNISLTTSGGIQGIDGVSGNALHDHEPYTAIDRIATTRYAKVNDVLQLTITNATSAHHPFHLHGFSFQPISFVPIGAGTSYIWPFIEFRDNLNIPAQHVLTFRVNISDRELTDGGTFGGALGRWMFHCHIFFHAHHGMMSELVITAPSGNEKPNVNVGGSWAYAPSGGTTTRTGTFYDKDLNNVTLVAHLDTGIPFGTLTYPIGTSSGTWSWQSPIGEPDTVFPHKYVYITATDSTGLQDQTVFRLKVGAPDDGSDNGDPHIHTVDGKSYDFQAAGEFILLMDNDGMEVQARQTPVLTANPITDGYSGLKSCVSLNTAVAARVGTHRIAYQPGREKGQFQFFVDGKLAKLTPEGLNLGGHHVSGFDVNGKTALRVDYQHHAVLIVTPLLWSSHNVWYLNVSISRTYANSGIMGAIPPNTWLPLLQNGASVGPMPAGLNDRYITLYKTFADSWRLTDKSSLFVYEPGTSTSTFTDKDWPAGKPPCNLNPQFEIPGWVIPEGMNLDKAKQICEIITDEGLNRDCVFDVATTGDEGFAKAYRITEELRNRSTGVQIISTKPGEITAIVSSLVNKKQPVPKGIVRFYANNVETGQPIELDASGHVKWKINGLDKGTYAIRAVYIPAKNTDSYPSSSPNLNVTLSESTKGNDGEVSNGCLGQPRYVWAVLIILLVLIIIWILFK